MASHPAVGGISLQPSRNASKESPSLRPDEQVETKAESPHENGQTPQAQAQDEPHTSPTPEPLPVTFTSSAATSRPWRLREAAHFLLDERGVEDGDDPQKVSMYLTTEFDTNLALDLETVQRTFHNAALHVVHCLKHPVVDKIDDDEDDRIAAEANNTDTYVRMDDIPDLPVAFVQARQILQKARRASMQRALDNKEWTKRRAPRPTKYKPVPVATMSTAAATEVKSTAAASAATTPKNGKGKTETATTPKLKVAKTKDNEPSPKTKKFTRNTPASSLAALDQRYTNSRAILCAAGNLVLSGGLVDPADVPQKDKIANMGQVVVDATVYSRRTLTMAENSRRRAQWRYQFRNKPNKDTENEDDIPFVRLPIPNLFSKERQWLDSLWEATSAKPMLEFQPQTAALTAAWQRLGRPALQQILDTTCNALYYDTQWNSRHGRLGAFLRLRQVQKDDWGPHLIVTTQPDVDAFAAEFYDWRTFLDPTKRGLRACRYTGNAEERLMLRRVWSKAGGWPTDAVHVVILSYATFLKDYIHFCQMPWGTVLLDDGASWMATSQGDPNSSLAALWEQAIWSKNDHFTGLAGTTLSRWNFEMLDWQENITSDNAPLKEAFIGLTARHRVLTASRMSVKQKQSKELLPVSGVVSFVAPHFAAVVKEEWDRNNIIKDTACMDHFRKLVARFTVVHHSSPSEEPETDMTALAVRALEGRLPLQDLGPKPLAPSEISDEAFSNADKTTFSRRTCLSWLGNGKFCLRYELGKAKFKPIFEVIKISNKHGPCEEITTASSLTNSGASGQLVGSQAYRLAVRCNRHFGSDQGMRIHVSAQHAPPGTWLCRTCATDCITSQGRTHHERFCGQPGAGRQDLSAGSAPVVGQRGPKSRVGKKKGKNKPTGVNGVDDTDEKDPDGSFRVPGYRGVWVTKQGKHFIKVDGNRFAEKENDTMLFDTIEDAAKKYDEIVSQNKKGDNLELNFKADGTRHVYEDSTSTTASGVGGSAANVVPLLSVINIKDLPPDVKPLLRDPRQTSRTGGNMKRHIYAYRGVCRQSRKGHDRWQSQISFMGNNHYLGTFDSEWDAAAIYAWAHLILYGEEATKQAQKEGEEAAAAYEQEKKDIAAGKIPEPSPTKKVIKKTDAKGKTTKKNEPKETVTKKKDPTEKQKTPGSKKKNEKSAEAGTTEYDIGSAQKKKEKSPGKRKPPQQEEEKVAKKRKVVFSAEDREALAATLTKGVFKSEYLGPRDITEKFSYNELRVLVSTRLKAIRSVATFVPSTATEALRPCFSAYNVGHVYPFGGAVLLGIPANLGWNFMDFLKVQGLDEDFSAIQMLAVEYDEDGLNEKFRSVIQGSLCIIGQATTQMIRQYRDIGGGNVAMGSGMGMLDCHIGGTPGTCSPQAASIRCDGEKFFFACLNDKDLVTLNGARLKSGRETVLRHNDVCSVGPRVFTFTLPGMQHLPWTL